MESKAQVDASHVWKSGDIRAVRLIEAMYPLFQARDPVALTQYAGILGF